MFYDRLKSLCDERGVNITNVVQELHMGSGNLSNWKSGRTPRGSTLSKLANYFKVSTDYLLGISDDPEKKPAPEDGDGLDEKQKELVRLYQAAAPELQAAALAVLRSAEGQSKAPGGVSEGE